MDKNDSNIIVGEKELPEFGEVPKLVFEDFQSHCIKEYLIQEDIRGLGVMICTAFIGKESHFSREEIVLVKAIGVPGAIALIDSLREAERIPSWEEMFEDLAENIRIYESLETPIFELEKIPKLFFQQVIKEIKIFLDNVALEPRWFIQLMSGVPP